MSIIRMFLASARLRKALSLGAIAALLVSANATSLQAQQPPPPRPLGFNQTADFEYLNRGPIHEAFAQPYEAQFEQRLVIDRPPPQQINELPPREAPVDPSFLWIPGYWGWEPAAQDYVWVSGIWRRPPYGLTWLPGYWTQADGGFSWVSGCWVPDGDVYMISRTPPLPQEEYPGDPPGDNVFYVPGYWDYTGVDFQWQPGFWSAGYEDRVWIPMHYVWTPNGYLVVDGYWDFPLEERGILFAPVQFPTQVAYTVQYTPQVIVRVSNLPTHLFVYGNYGHYCYGDYYGARISGGRFNAWTQLTASYYDPLWIYFSVYQRDRFRRYRDRHDFFVNHPNDRPRHTWDDDRNFRDRHRNDADFRDAFLGESYAQIIANPVAGSIQFASNERRWNEVRQQRDQVDRLRREREQFVDQQRNRSRDDAFDANLGPLRIRVNPPDFPRGNRRDGDQGQGRGRGGNDAGRGNDQGRGRGGNDAGRGNDQGRGRGGNDAGRGNDQGRGRGGNDAGRGNDQGRGRGGNDAGRGNDQGRGRGGNDAGRGNDQGRGRGGNDAGRGNDQGRGRGGRGRGNTPPKTDPPVIPPPNKVDPPTNPPKKVDPPKLPPRKVDPPKTPPKRVDPPTNPPKKVDPPKLPPTNPPKKVDPPKLPPRKIDPPTNPPKKVDPPKLPPTNPPKKVDPPKRDNNPPKKVDPPKRDNDAGRGGRGRGDSTGRGNGPGRGGPGKNGPGKDDGAGRGRKKDDGKKDDGSGRVGLQ